MTEISVRCREELTRQPAGYANVSEPKEIHLPDVEVSHFADFAKYAYHWVEGWLRPIVSRPENSRQSDIEDEGHRLIDALLLGVALRSAKYQHAAIRDFLCVASLLQRPEDYINDVFDCTHELAKTHPHCALNSIIAVVAAKRIGKDTLAGRRLQPRDYKIWRALGLGEGVVAIFGLVRGTESDEAGGVHVS